VARSRAFYEALGWRLTFTDGDIIMFQAGPMIVSLWGRSKLAMCPGRAGTDRARRGDCPRPGSANVMAERPMARRLAVVDDRFYFRQFLSGRDFARQDQIAVQMVNFVYAIGDRATGECVLVDPAYAVGELIELVGVDDMTVVGALATHYHADHVGGSMMGYRIEGVRELLEQLNVKVHVQEAEAAYVQKVTDLSARDLAVHDPGDVVTVGDVRIELVHTPGHTPGSQCFLVDGRLVSGDTLFLDGCGRTDLPGSDADAMYESLQLLARLPEDTIVYPGHRYSLPSSGTMDAVRATNIVYKPKSKDGWLMMFGQA
jgi:glyoxylase-like metal-dependent hydrolase (beta-lactamase superfamily II)